MNPIQEYTKQEKLATILEYNPCCTERNAVLRYLLAVRRDDDDEIAYFESFDDCVHQIILNVRTYERGLLFGYTTKQFDEYGWLWAMLPFIERIEQKIFHCEIVVDTEKVKREEKAYKKIPVITDFTDEEGNDRMKEMYRKTTIGSRPI